MLVPVEMVPKSVMLRTLNNATLTDFTRSWRQASKVIKKQIGKKKSVFT